MAWVEILPARSAAKAWLRLLAADGRVKELICKERLGSDGKGTGRSRKPPAE